MESTSVRRWSFMFSALVALLAHHTFAQSSPHGTISLECRACHVTSSWTELKVPLDFNHSATSFVLVGQHATTDCKRCHTTLRFAGTPSECFACHQKDFQRMPMPDHQRGQFSHDCTLCHSMTTWKPSIFDHRKTNFQLSGAHLAVDCISCHPNSKFAGIPIDCYSCHRNDFTIVLTPSHQRGNFSHECTACHTVDAWKPSTFDHTKTNFPLQGAHRPIDCSLCHTNSRFAGTPTDCYPCHQKDFASVVVPNHQTGQFSHDCTVCHTVNGWKPALFDHSKTNFPLTGAHITAACASCHPGGRYVGTSRDCYTCHQTDFAAAANPQHISSQLSHDCTTCHNTIGWKPSTFDHATTNFPLTGAHRTVDCHLCHAAGRFAGTPAACIACHQTDFANALGHQTNLFSNDCLQCHTVNAWKPSTFNHATTSFPLTGLHVTTDCIFCHKNGQYKGVSTTCYSCHQTDYARVTDPNHVTGGFDQNCNLCHSTTAWNPATFDHNKTNFVLTGAHRTVDCKLCHIGGKFAGTPITCIACHQTDYTGAANHQKNLFSNDCLQCHTVNAWKPSTFNHTATNFPLTGAHATTDCLFCHKNGQYKGILTTCYSCHQADYIRVSDPNHVTGGFDQNCSTCHTTAAWNPATFDHNKTNFALTGAHVQTACAKCHLNNRYAGTVTDCNGCHQQDYKSAINPNHASAAYPLDCASCHTTIAWQPSTFNHTPFFPISAGSTHRPGRWNFCSDCHVNSSSSKLFECITCHTHSKTQSDSQHRNRSGYVYASASCYKCHPLGRSGG